VSIEEWGPVLTEHEAVDRLLLPWYVNGTLGTEETRTVEHHLSQCAACRRELETLRQVQAAVMESPGEPPSPSRARLEQVLSRIDCERRQKTSRSGRG
jgi:anti-sigma factor RsiW